MKKIAIFASGNGSNAENIIRYFEHHVSVHVSVVATNNSNAKVLKRVKKYKVNTILFTQQELVNGHILTRLNEYGIEFIVLAGFLLKIPKIIITQYSNKIINIHPSLLPLYGGKGMYGNYVHQKVHDSKDTESGITIHFVNEKYDDGNIIFQAKCALEPHISVKKIAQKVHNLEMKFYPKIIESILYESD